MEQLGTTCTVYHDDAACAECSHILASSCVRNRKILRWTEIKLVLKIESVIFTRTPCILEVCGCRETGGLCEAIERHACGQGVTSALTWLQCFCVLAVRATLLAIMRAALHAAVWSWEWRAYHRPAIADRCNVLVVHEAAVDHQ